MKEDEKIEFICQECGVKFFKTKRDISKNKGKIPKFCSVECYHNHIKQNNKIIVHCLNCGKEKCISKGEYNKNKNKHFFCNSSCSASYNNKQRDNKKIDESTICPICGGKKWKTSKMCFHCSSKNKNEINNKTLGDFVKGKKYSTINCGDIRRAARKVMENSEKEKVCAYCHNHEFDGILEVHHIKGIMSFSHETKISEINDINNLVWLCPNHHKMLELGLIELNL